MQMKKDRLALNKQLDWLRARTNQNRLERLKKINDENEGNEKPESSDEKRRMTTNPPQYTPEFWLRPQSRLQALLIAYFNLITPIRYTRLNSLVDPRSLVG